MCKCGNSNPSLMNSEGTALLKFTTTSFKLYGLPSLSASGNLSGTTSDIEALQCEAQV